jgi:branched-chain amino acid transport system permease protein
MRAPARLPLPEQPMLRHLTLAAVAAVFFFLLTISISPYHDYEVGLIALYAIAIAGLSMLTGVNGQISLGQGAFMAVGAYAFALMQVHTHLPLVVEFLAAIAASAALGVVVGIPATRLRGPYLAGMTLILALGLPQLADKYSSVFHGDQGLAISPPVPPGSVNPERWLTGIEILGALIAIVLVANLTRSHFGRSMRAVRDGDIPAALAGIHVGRTKVLAFVVSAGCAGLAGAFLGLSTGVVNPGEFAPVLSIYLLAAMVLGGAGSLAGVWWGAIAVVYLPQWSTSLSNAFNLGSAVSANLAIVFYGLVLIVVMMLFPAGIQGGVRWLGQRLLCVLGSRLSPIIPAVASAGPGGDPPSNELPTSETETERTHP